MAIRHRMAGHEPTILAARAATTAILPHQTGDEPDHPAHNPQNLHTAKSTQGPHGGSFFMP